MLLSYLPRKRSDKPYLKSSYNLRACDTDRSDRHGTPVLSSLILFIFSVFHFFFCQHFFRWLIINTEPLCSVPVSVPEIVLNYLKIFMVKIYRFRRLMFRSTQLHSFTCDSHWSFLKSLHHVITGAEKNLLYRSYLDVLKLLFLPKIMDSLEINTYIFRMNEINSLYKDL